MFKDYGVVERALQHVPYESKFPTCQELKELEEQLGPNSGVEIDYKTGKIKGIYNWDVLGGQHDQRQIFC